MTDIHFYHLTSTPLERALPKLLEKAYQAGFRIIVLMESEAKAEWMNTLLWTYEPDSFLPHGSAKDGDKSLQPIYITYQEENPNNANVLVITDGSELELDNSFVRVIDIFDGNDAISTQKAHLRMRKYEAESHTVVYRKQSTSGGWK